MLSFICVIVLPGGDNCAHFIDVKTEMRFNDPKVASKGLKPLAPCQARRLRSLSQAPAPLLVSSMPP